MSLDGERNIWTDLLSLCNLGENCSCEKFIQNALISVNGIFPGKTSSLSVILHLAKFETGWVCIVVCFSLCGNTFVQLVEKRKWIRRNKRHTKND